MSLLLYHIYCANNLDSRAEQHVTLVSQFCYQHVFEVSSAWCFVSQINNILWF